MATSYNSVKSLVKDYYHVLKGTSTHPPQTVISNAINLILATVQFGEVFHPQVTFSSQGQLSEHLLNEIQFEVNGYGSIEGGSSHALTDPEGHIDWYREKISRDEIKFTFWNRYKKYLANIKGWSDGVVTSLDRVTDEILEKIEDPQVRNRAFDRRGLVVGYVQSGKTANFMGIINKSIDAGYRVIVVLSGLHNNLRSQTQMRIDEEVIGRDTSINSKSKKIGVSTLPGESYINIDTLTTQDDKGDFNIATARKAGVQPGRDRPIVFVVKKNVSVLRNLTTYFKEWITMLDGEFVSTGEDDSLTLNNSPLLVIDDESDQASPNTKATENEDGELDPTKTNFYIRELLSLFNQSAYIAYTATPFANIFIHHENDHSRLGKDLFPASFIISLDPPPSYFGPVRVFGLQGENDIPGLPIHIPVTDTNLEDAPFLPAKSRQVSVPIFIPDSMKDAIRSFLISSAIRILRGQARKHNTMLIHCTRFTQIQNAIAELVNDEFSLLREGILNEDHLILTSLKHVWTRDYRRISSLMGVEAESWDQIAGTLKAAVLKMERHPLVINGSVGDVLDYKVKDSVGLSVIAIGGDKLSRGLTLEGLSVSYFTRTSVLYDTLMQMGRWFGYRQGYEDVCRIYTTPDLYSWYRHISTAFESLRREFLEMKGLRATPKEYGLRVLSHPDMMVTSALKMRNSESLPLTYRGVLTQTISFSKSPVTIAGNRAAMINLIAALGDGFKPKHASYLWKQVPVDLVLDFLKEYKSHPSAPASNTKRIIDFIEIASNRSVLKVWNVALYSTQRQQTEWMTKLGGLEISMGSRAIKVGSDADKLDISVLTGSQDETIDFENPVTSSGRKLREEEPRRSCPLLTLYVMKAKTDKDSVKPEDPIIYGFAISWPDNPALQQTTYEVNSVYQELKLDEL